MVLLRGMTRNALLDIYQPSLCVIWAMCINLRKKCYFFLWLVWSKFLFLFKYLEWILIMNSIKWLKISHQITRYHCNIAADANGQTQDSFVTSKKFTKHLNNRVDQLMKNNGREKVRFILVWQMTYICHLEKLVSLISSLHAVLNESYLVCLDLPPSQ